MLLLLAGLVYKGEKIRILLRFLARSNQTIFCRLAAILFLLLLQGYLLVILNWMYTDFELFITSFFVLALFLLINFDFTFCGEFKHKLNQAKVG